MYARRGFLLFQPTKVNAPCCTKTNLVEFAAQRVAW